MKFGKELDFYSFKFKKIFRKNYNYKKQNCNYKIIKI